MAAQHAPDSRRATIWMLTAVVSFSLIPLVVSVAHAKDAPLLFGAYLRIGQLVTMAAVLGWLWKDVVRSADTRAVLAGAIFQSKLPWIHPALVWAAVSYFEYTLFIWALSYIHVSTATVLFEIWPIMLTVLMWMLFKDEKRYRRPDMTGTGLIMMAFAGAVLLVASEVDPMHGASRRTVSDIAIGAALAIAAGLALGCAAFTFRWAHEVGVEIGAGEQSVTRAEIFATILAAIIGSGPGSWCTSQREWHWARSSTGGKRQWQH